MKWVIVDVPATYVPARFRCRHCTFRTNSEEQMHAHILHLSCPAGSKSYHDAELSGRNAA